MKNSPTKIVSNSQRVRANAVWLMNAASLAVAVTAVVNGPLNFAPAAKGAVMVWQGGGTDGSITTNANWTNYYAGNAGVNPSSATAATLDSQTFNAAGTQRTAVTVTANRHLGALTFDNYASTNAYTLQSSSGTIRELQINAGGGGNFVVFTNNYTAGNVTFASTLSVVNGNADGNIWTGAYKSNTLFQGNFAAYSSGLARGPKIQGEGNFTFAKLIGVTAATASGLATTGLQTMSIENSGTTILQGANTLGGVLTINQGTSANFTTGGITRIQGDNSGTGLNLAAFDAANGATYAIKLTRGTVLLENNLALGASTRGQVVGSVSTVSTDIVKLLTNGAYTIANNIFLGASTSGAGATYTIGGYTDASSTFSGTITVNKSSTISQAATTGSNKLTVSGGISGASAGKVLTFDGAGAIEASGVIGTNIAIQAGSDSTSSTRVVTLSGSNTFTDGVTINSGVLALGNANAIGSTSAANAITWGASTTGTLRLNGNSVTVKSVNTNATAGSGIIENASGSNTDAVLTIGNSANADSTYAGVIKNGNGTGKLGINKVGTGTLTLSGANTYTGDTNVTGGTLALTGSLTGSAVTIGASGTLKGTGTSNGALSLSGTVNPGSAGVGTLTTGATDLKGGGTLNIQFFSGSGAAGSTGWDLLSTGALTTSANSGSKFNINLSSITTLGADTAGAASVFNNASDQTFEIIRATSLVTGFDASLFNLSTTGFTNGLGGGSWSLTSSGNSIYASFAKYIAGTISYWSAGTWDSTASGTGSGGSWNDASNSLNGNSAVFAGATGGTVAVGTVTAKKGITFSTTGYTLSAGTIALADTSGLNTVTVDTGVAAEINSALSGTGGFTKAGTGTLTLSGDNNSLSGGMTIGLGTVKVGNAKALGASSSAVTVTSGAVLDLNGTTMTNTNALSIAGTGALVNTANTGATYAGNVTLTGATSYVATTGAITMTGTTNLNNYGLTLTGGASDISLTNSISGTGSITIAPGTGAVNLASVGHTGAITIDSATVGAGTTTIGGNIASSVTTLTIGNVTTIGSNTGTVVLNGNNSNAGTVTLYSGKLKLGSATALGNATNAVNVKQFTSGAVLDLNGQTITNTNALTLYGTGFNNTGVLINSSAAKATYSGTISLAGTTTIGATGGDIDLNGVISAGSTTARTVTFGGNNSTPTNINIANGGITNYLNGATGVVGVQVGNGGSDTVQVNFLGSTNFTGLVKIAGGTLKLASASSLNSTVALNSGGSLTDTSKLLLTAGNNYSIANLGIGGILVFDTTDVSASTTFTVTAGGNSTTSTGYGQTGSSGKRITVNQGLTLVIGSGGTAPASYFDLIGNAGTGDKIFRIDGAGTTTINSILREQATTNATANIKGGLCKVGTGLLVLNAANTYTGGTTVDAGTVKIGNATALGANTSAVTVSAGATLDLNGTTMTGANALTLSGTATNTGSSDATYHGSLTLGASTATLTADARNLTLDSATDVTGAYTLTLNGANNGSLSGALKNGAGGLNKSGAGNWTLSGTGATYTGTTNITAGTLTLGASNVIGSGAVTVNGGTLALGSNSDTVGTVTLTSGSITGSGALTSSADYAVSSGTISAVLAGSVGLTKTTSGTVTLSGLNTYTGTTTINGGTLEISNFGGIQGNTGGVGANASGLGQATNVSSKLVVNGGTLKYTGAGETTDRKIKFGSTATIDASGTGALVLNGNPGESWVSGTTNSTLTLTGTNTGNNTWTQAIMNNSTSGSTGVTSLVKDGVGTWVLAATGTSSNNFTGGTTINAGTLKAGTANIVGNITNNSVFEFTNTTSGSYAGVISGTGTLNKSGAGAVTLTGNNNYSGVTNINAGSLILDSNTGKISASSAINVYKGASLKSTNTTDSTQQASDIVLKTGGLLDLSAGSLKATSLTVDALTVGDISKINFGIGNSLSLTSLALNGNIAIDLLGTPTVAGTYDVLTWTTKSGSSSFNLLTQDTADWVYSTNLDNTAKKYSITITRAFREGGDYTSGSISVPTGGTLGAVSGTTIVTAATSTTVGAISGGTVNLSGGNNTVGAVSGGTVNLNAAGSTVASLATGGTLNVKADSTVTSLTGGTLSVDSGINATVTSGTSTAKITGAGNLLKTGNGTLTLSGTTSDYTGATTVQSGIVQVTDVAALGSTSGVTLGVAGGSNNAKLQIAATGATELSKNIVATNTTSANIVENSGNGALTLSGSLTKNGTVLTLAGGTNGINVTGNIIGSAANSDLVVSSGIVKVSSSNSYNGPTFVQAGATLIADNASATGTGIVNVANGATLQVGTATHMLTLTTGGFALTNGAHIKVYVDHVNITGLTINSGANIDTRYAHYDLTGSAGTTYSTLFTSGALDLTGVTVGGITIDVYSTDSNSLMQTNPFYDFKFLEAATITGLGSRLNIADLFTINTSNLKYANGNTVTGVSGWGDYSDLIKVYTVTNGSNTVLMMSIPEPSTYGLGLGALALAAVAIRRRKQKKATV